MEKFQRFANNPFFLKLAVRVRKQEQNLPFLTSFIKFQCQTLNVDVGCFVLYTQYHFPQQYFLRELNIKNGSFSSFEKFKINKTNNTFFFKLWRKLACMFVQIYIFQDLVIWTEMAC